MHCCPRYAVLNFGGTMILHLRGQFCRSTNESKATWALDISTNYKKIWQGFIGGNRKRITLPKFRFRALISIHQPPFILSAPVHEGMHQANMQHTPFCTYSIDSLTTSSAYILLFCDTTAMCWERCQARNRLPCFFT